MGTALSYDVRTSEGTPVARTERACVLSVGLLPTWGFTNDGPLPGFVNKVLLG